MIWQPETLDEARRMAWDADDWDEGIAHCLTMLVPDGAWMREGPSLDYGCGPGRLTAAVHHRTWAGMSTVESVGYDPNPKMLHESDNDAVRFVDRLTGLGTFGFVFSVLVLQHLDHESQHAAIDNMAAMCGRGGTVRVQFTYEGDTGPLSNPTPRPTMTRWMRDAGLVSVWTELDPVYPTWAWAEGQMS